MSILWRGRCAGFMLFLTFSHTTLPYLHICFMVSEPVTDNIEDDAYKAKRAFYLEQLAASFNLDNPSKPSYCIDAMIKLTHQTIALEEQEANRHEDDLRALKSASEELHGQILDRFISMIFSKGQPKQAPTSLNAESNAGSQSVRTEDLSLSRAPESTIINNTAEVSAYSGPWSWAKSLVSGSST
jgi:hypothetical protein